ncbi:hypothetical protein KM481_gp49 [Harp seal herpesvirus]|uniref:Herpesvirus envelope glycoprotein N domain-containing protein n=1 Tax=phocid gammaherpesvirus 3 TaxID=2560643 RepID=A0A0R5Z8W9_9GAMA|nr:hypothetical protein KM481_gp49 [Harp seal herpesvirus]AJG42979.1 hypothetical protein [Harp seal herpesvirus]
MASKMGVYISKMCCIFVVLHCTAFKANSSTFATSPAPSTLSTTAKSSSSSPETTSNNKSITNTDNTTTQNVTETASLSSTMTVTLVTTSNTTSTPALPSFYDYSCNADTYKIELTSFSSIWALLNVVIVLFTTILYLIYICFTRFVTTMALS